MLLMTCLCLRAQVEVDARFVPAGDPFAGDSVLLADDVPVDAMGGLMFDDEAIAAVSDTMPVASVIEVPEYLLQAVSRSWRRAHPLGDVPHRRTSELSMRVRFSLDSLRREVRSQAPDACDMLYLYDMRLPLISTGSVPADTSLTLFGQVSQLEERADCDAIPVSHFEDAYLRQQRNEAQRHLARFNYASVDPRRFRFARRRFDVPTVDSHIIDTRETVSQTRIADDIEVDFGQADVDLYWPGVDFKADKWHWKGDHSLTMQQTALTENWYKGGSPNMSVSGEQKITISRYDEEKITTFETILDLKLSGYYTKADTVHSMKVSDNELSLTVKYGRKAWKKWYYSTQLYAKTPVFDFYENNSGVCKSTFLSPLELNLSFGVDYQYTSPNKRFNYSLLLAPLSYDLKAIADHRINVTSYGLAEGETVLHKFGSTITSKFDWKMGRNASWSSRLYCFTSYNSVKVEFENTLDFKISRFFNAKIYAYPRFDDTRDTEVEVKEMLTIGFSYQW